MNVRSSPDHFMPGDYLPFPFFMAYAASYVAKATGADVHLRDSIALRESKEVYYRHLASEKYDYVFIESSTPSWDWDSRIIRRIKEAVLPDCKIVVTGPLTTTNAEKILASHPVHACIRGEYEKGSVRVLGGESGVVDFDLLTREEMNRAPFPHFDPITAHRYWDCNPVGQVFPHAQVWSSRGCPFKCNFCLWPATMTGNDPIGDQVRSVRHYSAEYMLAFLSHIVDTHGFKSIYFDDDTMNLTTSHTVAMCGVMKKIGLPWSAMCRADTIKLETWGLMKESGCFGVKIGIETGSQRVMDEIINKHLDLNVVRQVVAELKRLGIKVHGTFTVGHPGETQEEVAQTMALMQELRLDSSQLSGVAEHEGTPLHALVQLGTMEKYPGAKVDENYRRESDGARKMAAMIEDIRNS